jgi:molybdenum-dependent DNA-binding transcriptional regulator ModE
MAALALPCQELQYIAEIGSGDEPARKIYASYQQFRTLITDWSDISERAVLNSRVA